MRIVCLLVLLIFSSQLRAETWECKPPIEDVPWSAIELIAVSGGVDEASVRIGEDVYTATYESDGTSSTWILGPNPAKNFSHGVLTIDPQGNATLWRELNIGGVIVHAEGSYVCRKADAAVD